MNIVDRVKDALADGAQVQLSINGEWENVNRISPEGDDAFRLSSQGSKDYVIWLNDVVQGMRAIFPVSVDGWLD